LNDNNFDLDEIKKENNNTFMKIPKTIKIKFVITEIPNIDKNDKFRKFMSPIKTNFNNTQSGYFHIGLVIGPWYLECKK
jgi:hypothetical protein